MVYRDRPPAGREVGKTIGDPRIVRFLSELRRSESSPQANEPRARHIGGQPCCPHSLLLEVRGSMP